MQFLNNKIQVCEIQIQIHREFDIGVAHLKWMSFIFMEYKFTALLYNFLSNISLQLHCAGWTKYRSRRFEKFILLYFTFRKKKLLLFQPPKQ